VSARLQQNEEVSLAQSSAHFFAPQSQSLPQLHSLLLFIGQFLPVFLQLCFSAAKAPVQTMAARIDIRILIEVFIRIDSA